MIGDVQDIDVGVKLNNSRRDFAAFRRRPGVLLGRCALEDAPVVKLIDVERRAVFDYLSHGLVHCSLSDLELNH